MSTNKYQHKSAIRFQLLFILLLCPLQGRSKSLTSIDALGPALSAMDIDVNESAAGVSAASAAAAADRLMVPPRCDSASAGGSGGGGGTSFSRRRKLSTAGKVR